LIRVGHGPYTLEGCDRGGFLKVDAKIAMKYLQQLEHVDGDDEQEEEEEVDEKIQVVGVEDTRAIRRKPMTRSEARLFK
jgi:hypothetical protein